MIAILANCVLKLTDKPRNNTFYRINEFVLLLLWLVSSGGANSSIIHDLGHLARQTAQRGEMRSHTCVGTHTRHQIHMVRERQGFMIMLKIVPFKAPDLLIRWTCCKRSRFWRSAFWTSRGDLGGFQNHKYVFQGCLLMRWTCWGGTVKSLLTRIYSVLTDLELDPSPWAVRRSWGIARVGSGRRWPLQRTWTRGWRWGAGRARHSEWWWGSWRGSPPEEPWSRDCKQTGSSCGPCSSGHRRRWSRPWDPKIGLW